MSIRFAYQLLMTVQARRFTLVGCHMHFQSRLKPLLSFFAS